MRVAIAVTEVLRLESLFLEPAANPCRWRPRAIFANDCCKTFLTIRRLPWNFLPVLEEFVGSEADQALRPIEGIERNASVVYPIIASSDVTGAIIILFNEKNTPPTQVEVKLAQAAAAFLGKQMED